MGFLSGKSEVQDTEPGRYLPYLEEELKLMMFRAKEQELYDGALAKYGFSVAVDSNAAREMRRASDRLVQAVSEILRRRDKMAASVIPDEVSAVYSAWQKAYLAYSEYAKAESAGWEGEAKGTRADYRRMRKLFSQAEDLRHKASREQNKFARRLKMSDEVVEKLMADASAAVLAEGWQPKEIEEA